MARWRLVCGVVGGPLFALGTVFAGFRRAGYSVRRHPVSSLALGPHGWIQSANFLAGGLLLFAFSGALGRGAPGAPGTPWGQRMLRSVSVCLVGAGLATTEPVSGYPPGTPAMPATFTVRGAVHLACAIVGFAALVAATFAFARAFARLRARGWAIFSLASGVVTIAAFLGATQGFTQRPGWVERAGLFERVAFLVGFGWSTALALKLAYARPRGDERVRTARTRLRGAPAR